MKWERRRKVNGKAYDVADVGAFDDKGAQQNSIVSDVFLDPGIHLSAVGCIPTPEFTELIDEVIVDAHISSEDRANHKCAHLCILKDGGPVPAEYLGVSSAVKGLENRSVVVELGEGSIELDEEHVVDAWMAYIMTQSNDKECEGVKRGDKR